MSTASRVKKMKEEIEALRNGTVEEVVEPIQEPVTEPSDDFSLDEPAQVERLEEKVETTKSEPEPSIKSKEDDPNYWKHRFEVLQGMHNKEIGDLRDQLLETQRQMLEISTRQTNVAMADDVEEVIDSLEDEYGEDFTSAIDKRVEKIVAAKIKSLEKDFESVKKTAYKNDQQMFEESLSKEVPNWQEINVDRGFIGWLGNVEPYSGLTMHQLLLNAYERQDINRVAKVFKDYSQLTKSENARPNVSNVPDPDVAPSRRGSASHSTIEANQGKVYTVAQIEQFYTDLRQGKYRGKEAWTEKMRSEIAKAGTEGRIVG